MSDAEITRFLDQSATVKLYPDLIQVGRDINVDGKITVLTGIVLTSPNGTKYLLSVDNAGSLTVAPA